MALVVKKWRSVAPQNSRDDSLLNLLADLGLGNLLHLGEDHGRDLLGGEGLLLAEVLDLNEGGAVLVDNGEGPVLKGQRRKIY